MWHTFTVEPVPEPQTADDYLLAACNERAMGSQTKAAELYRHAANLYTCQGDDVMALRARQGIRLCQGATPVAIEPLTGEFAPSKCYTGV